MSDGDGAGKKAFGTAASPSAGFARRRSEGVTLAFAVVVAVGLGVAFGIWINARLTPNTTANALRPAGLLPDARASAPPAPDAPAVRPTPCDGCETSSAGEASPPRGSADEADEAGPGTVSPATKGVAREAATDSGTEPRRADEVAAVKAEPEDVKDSGAVVVASPEPSRPVAWEVGPLPKAGRRAAARANVEPGAARFVERAADGGAKAQPRPCAMYASASSLSLSLGTAAPLILGGPGEGVRINVSTPDWSEIAVIYEGPAAGHNGWLRYSVRSVGRRPGSYTVCFSTPCGSQTIPVTVK